MGHSLTSARACSLAKINFCPHEIRGSYSQGSRVGTKIMITTSCYGLRLRSGGSPIRAGPPEDPLRPARPVHWHWQLHWQVGRQFEPYRWRPCGVTWDSSQTVVVIKLWQTSALCLFIFKGMISYATRLRRCLAIGGVRTDHPRRTTPYHSRQKKNFFCSQVNCLVPSRPLKRCRTWAAITAKLLWWQPSRISCVKLKFLRLEWHLFLQIIHLLRNLCSRNPTRIQRR